MNGFYIEITNTLLSPEHCENMGVSVWLFMWYIDKITIINKDGKGKVLGGKPIKYDDIKKDLGITRKRYVMWLSSLRKGGYIETVRTPNGVSVSVIKAKKRFNKRTGKLENKPESDVGKMEHQGVVRDAPEMAHDCPLNGTCLLPKGNMQDQTISFDNNNDKNNLNIITAKAVNKLETIGILNTNNETTNGNGILEKENNPHSPLKEKVADEVASTPKEKTDGQKINEILSLFLRILPGDFIGSKSAFAKPATREAVLALSKRYSVEQIKDLISKYESGKTDQYRPQVGTVYEFCTIKLAKIEAFVAKKPNVLWAQRSVCTPEQSDVRDKQYEAVMEASRERSRRNKAEWELTHPKK